MQENNQYRAGEQNIGFREVSVRKKFLYFFTVVTIVTTIWSYQYCQSMLCWWIMLFSAFSFTVLFLEVKYKFCILFGFFNLFNFGRLGELSDVKSREDGKKDMKRVIQITLLSLFLAVSYASVVHWLALLK